MAVFRSFKGVCRVPWGVLGRFNRLSNILAGLAVVKVKGMNLARG